MLNRKPIFILKPLNKRKEELSSTTQARTFPVTTSTLTATPLLMIKSSSTQEVEASTHNSTNPKKPSPKTTPSFMDPGNHKLI
jgi:hypothetical protein